MSMLKIFVAALPLVATACGTTPEDRGLSGAGIGAAGGAVIGAFTGIGPVGGALIGGAVGGATGVLTDPGQVDLGKPVWRQGSSASGPQASAPPPDQRPSDQIANVSPSASASYDTVTVRNIQTGLQRLGYDPGSTDGHFGSQTEAAIRRYQQDNRMPVDGQPSAALWEQIRSRAPS